MSAKIAGPLVAAVAVAGASVAAPYWFGSQIENGFREGIAKAPGNPYYHLEVERYDRGWRTAEAVTAIKFTPPKGDPFTLQLDSHIEHGPFVGGLGQARITTTPRLTPEMATFLEQIFADEAPLVATVDIGLGGAVDGTLESPASSAQIGGGGALMALEWKGLDSTFHLDGGLSNATFAGELPGLALGPVGAPPAVSFEGLKLDGKGHKSEGSGLWMSSGSLDLAKMNASDPTGRTSTMSGLRVTSQADEKDGLIQMVFGMSAGQFAIGEEAFKDMSFNVSMHDIDAAAMKQFQEFVEKNGANANEEEMGQLMAAQMQQLGGKFLARKPSFAIDQLSFTYKNEPVSAKASVQYVGAGDAAAFNPTTDLTGMVRVEAPQAAVRRIAQAQQLSMMQKQRASLLEEGGGELTAVSAEETAAMDLQAQAASNEMIDGLVAQGMILTSGADRFMSEATIDQGQILLNGKPFGPPPGGSPEGSMEEPVPEEGGVHPVE